MPTIGYGYQIIEPQYKANLQNVDLIAKVLMSKQREYDTAYAGLKDEQKTALGINFLNKKEQAKIDAFNQKVSQSFQGGEFGDLSDPRAAEKYYTLFNEIGQDATLISRYRQDASYQDQVRAVEEKRRAKDPAKAGFGALNYDNFMGDLQDYSQMDLDSPDAKGFTLQPYTDYVDIHKELGDRMKNVPVKKFDVVTNKGGYQQTKTYTGRDPNDVGASTQEYMSDRGAAQVREQAKYTFRKAKHDPSFQQAIYADHVKYNTEAQQQIQTELTKTSEDLKKEQNPQKIQELSGKQARLEGELGKLQTGLKSADEYFNRDSDEIINDISQIALHDIIVSSKEAFGGYAVSEKVEPDRAYLEVAKMQQRAAEFQIEQNLKERELALRGEVAQNNDENTKARIGVGGTSGTTGAAGAQGTGNVTGATMQPNYFSASEPTHIDFISTVDSAKSTLEKLYAQQSNPMKDGITHGDNQMPGEQVALTLMIDPKALDGNPYYSNSPYVRAFQAAWDEVYKSDRALSEYLGKRPTDNYGWDRLKEANAKVQARVKQMIEQPKDRDEAQFSNALQDVNANLESVADFMAAANKSGNPDQYIKDQQNVKIYSNAVYDFTLPDNATKVQKQRVNDMEVTFKPTFVNSIGGPDEKTGVQVRDIPFDQIARIETGPDGTVKVFPKAEAFTVVTKGSGDEKETVPGKTGFLSAPGSYIKTKDGVNFKVSKAEQIKAMGYFETKDPRFAKMNWGNQLGFTVGAKPQKRWDASSDGQTVPFETRRSTLNNHVQVSVMGGEWQEYPSSDVTAVIAEVRKAISARPYAELQPQSQTP